MLIGGLFLAIGTGIVAARDSLILNWTPSVPVGFYALSNPARATFVTFCLPPLPLWVRHDPGVCTWSNSNGLPILKRLVASGPSGLYLCGDTGNALDSRVFGPLPTELVRGYWRPVLTWSWPGRHNSFHEVIGQRPGECSVEVNGAGNHALGNQEVADGSNRGDIHADGFRDFSGSMGSRPSSAMARQRRYWASREGPFGRRFLTATR